MSSEVAPGAMSTTSRILAVVAIAVIGTIALLVWAPWSGDGDVATATAASSDAEPAAAASASASPAPTAAVPTTAPVMAPTPTPVPPTPTPAPTPTPTPVPPPPMWSPSPLEVQPDAKTVGAEIVYALTNYEADASFDELVALTVSEPERQAELLAIATPVLHRGFASRGTIEYAQLGGLTFNKTSIMTVVRQEISNNAGLDRVETRTFDIRLQRGSDGRWELERVASVGGMPVPRPANLSAAATAVLDDPRITLPDSARWDIFNGHTQESLLELMGAMADLSPYSAVVLHTGHPINVFETNRRSNHTSGRAIDIYRVGSTNVVDGRDPGSEPWDFALQLAQRRDVRQLGSPWQLSGTVPTLFTDQVHQDHLHVATP